MSELVERVSQDSTVDRILDAGEMLFAEYGYEGTTLRLIAREVGIKEPSIYAHFASKEVIYGAVIDRALQPFHAEIESWVKTELTLRDIFQIPRKLLELHSRHPYAARIMHREFCNPVDRISPQVMAWLELIASHSGVFMQEMLGSEVPLDRAKVVTYMITLTNITLGFFSTRGMQMKLMGDQYSEEALFEEFIAILSKIFRGVLL